MKDLLHLGLALLGFMVATAVGSIFLQIFFSFYDLSVWVRAIPPVLAFPVGAKLYGWLRWKDRGW